MVASIDGSTAVDGGSAKLGNANDSAVLKQLRSIADVIIVGAGTARAEGYGPPSKPGQRIGVVTASARVDVDTPLFTSGAGFLITTTTASVTASVDTVRAGDDAVDLRAALARVGHGVRRPPGRAVRGRAEPERLAVHPRPRRRDQRHHVTARRGR